MADTHNPPFETPPGPEEEPNEPIDLEKLLEEQSLKESKNFLVGKNKKDLQRLREYSSRAATSKVVPIPPEVKSKQRKEISSQILSLILSEKGRARLKYYDYSRRDGDRKSRLTMGEFQKYWLLTAGYSLDYIAAAWDCSPATIENSFRSIEKKKLTNLKIEDYFAKYYNPRPVA